VGVSIADGSATNATDHASQHERHPDGGRILLLAVVTITCYFYRRMRCFQRIPAAWRTFTSGAMVLGWFERGSVGGI
jgi:hypothetical protein